MTAETLDVQVVDAGAEQLHTRIDDIIRDALLNQPRSLQRQIGPSEIGEPCDRWVMWKIVGREEPKRAQVPWKPALGTFAHAGLEEIFGRANGNYDEWVTEHKVTVGYLPDGTAITGHSDLFHVPTRTVIDWKIVGDRQLQSYRANGPSERYRVQAHLYGGGFTMDPEPWGATERVAIYFLPRDREFEKGYFWSEPWNPTIWSDALNRLNRLWRECDRVGMPTAAEALPLCENRFCHWCREIERDAAGSARKNLFDELPVY